MVDSVFIDRTEEIEQLRSLARDSGPQFGLLYGRRRVGKTYLLQHAWSDEADLFYFLAGSVTSEQNRRDLLRELSDFSDRSLKIEDYPNWRTTFRVLFDHAREASLIIVLDEFQYLLGDSDEKRREFTSQLNAVWDRWVEKDGLDLTLLICGSEIGTMDGIGASGPLYGRISWRERLQPFDYFDAARMSPGRSLRRKAYLYGIFGGLPEYLDAVRDDETLEDATVRTVLSPRGEIHFQLERLLEQEQGLRNPRKYRAVLSAVASGHTTTNEIKQHAFDGGTNHRVRRILETLEELGLIRRERNFGAGPTVAWRNRLADPAVRFWYRFVHPNRSRLEAGEARNVWRHVVEPRLDTYMGKIFEGIVADAYTRHHRRWGLPVAADWARWEGTDRNRKSIEIDIVAELRDQTMLTGEIKWSSSPVDIDLHSEHRAKIETLADSGHRWAHEALESEFSGGHLYVSAAGFSSTFEERAKDDDALHLIDLEDLYASEDDTE